MHLLHECARVLRTDYRNECCEVEAEVPRSVREKLARFVVGTDVDFPVDNHPGSHS